jgi:hypothetical protein
MKRRALEQCVEVGRSPSVEQLPSRCQTKRLSFARLSTASGSEDMNRDDSQTNDVDDDIEDTAGRQ